MKRLAVYVFWERRGIVRDYVITYLKGLLTVADKLYIVVNGELCSEGRERIIQDTGAVIIQRPNEGVDFWAYKTALDQEGDAIASYDEVILCNCSCYGPIYPFTEMFEEMGKRAIDFWGITEWPMNGGGYQGKWILSYFLVFRPHMFLSEDWINYWKNLSPVHSREECIEKHETKFTAYFAERGFTYDVYCRNAPGYLDTTIEAPDELVIQQRCPILKRKVFCTDYGRFLPYRRGDASKRVFDYLQEHHLYDTEQILDDMLATQHGAYLRDSLQMYYVLPDTYTQPYAGNVKAAVWFQMLRESLLDENFHLLCKLPSFVNIYIITSGKLLEVIEQKVSVYNIKNCVVQYIEQIGGVFDSLLKTSNQLEDYDCVCVLHDGYMDDSEENCIAAENRRFVTDMLVASPDYVRNICGLFEQNSRLGLLSPVDTLHGPYCIRYGQEWGGAYPITAAILQQFEIDSPISESIPPVAPLSGMFWFRPAALIVLLQQGGKIRENCGNKEFFQAVLRSLPFFAQSAGYLSGNVIASSQSENHIANLSYAYRQANLLLRGSTDVVFAPVAVNIGAKRVLKNYLKRYLPPYILKILKKFYYVLCRK